MDHGAWARYQESGVVEQVREPIAASWTRARAQLIDPHALPENYVDVEDESELVRVTAPVLAELVPLITGQASSLSISDAHGALLWRSSSERSLIRKLDAIGVAPHHSFAESLVGTNGLGLALHTGKASIVVGPEHFKAPWHQWTCAAAPLKHPITGQLIGAVNIACRVEHTSPKLEIALRTAIGQLRLAFWESAGGADRRLVDARQRLRTRTGRPTVGLNERTMLIDDEAAGQVGTRQDLWDLLHADPQVTSIKLPNGQLTSVFRVSDQIRDGFILVLEERVHDAPGTIKLGKLEQVERDVIAETLRGCSWNRSHAAEELGISRGTLYSRMRRYGLTAPVQHQ